MRDYSFSISSCMLDNANKRSIKPDKDGIYKQVCLMVLGNQPSQNGKIYEPTSMYRAMTDPNAVFYKKLIAGGVHGEYGHPFITDESQIARIATIDMTKVSHIIVKIYTGEATEKGNRPVYGDIVPYGPYGQYCKESLESPVLNTSFSLRSLVEKTGTTPEGYIMQTVLTLASIDMVDTGGYRAAAKYAPVSAVEGYEIPLKKTNTEGIKALVSEEVISDHQLEDMFGLDKITILHNDYQVDNTGIMKEGRQASIFHTFFNH